ncbi:hypothetical protein ACC807_10925 [Rhizobium ruizarguesonis]
MSFISLPWVAGPVPILATIWSAYVTTTALVYRREMTGERFVAAFLFPLGLVALISMMFLKAYDLPILIAVGQLVTTLWFAAIYIFVNKRPGDTPAMPINGTSIYNISWMLYFFVIVYIIYLIFIFVFPISDACTISKCYTLLLGGKEHGFSVLYSLNFVGSAILSFIVLILFQIITNSGEPGDG